MTSDDEVLDRLQAAFAIEDAEPSVESVHALRMLVALSLAAPGATATPSRSRRRYVKALVSAGLVVGAFGGSSAAFAATGTPLPRPVRVVAHGIGLPVDSVPVADTRHAADDLRKALDRHDPIAINRASAKLEADLVKLKPKERAEVQSRTGDLLERATKHSDDQNARGGGEPERHDSSSTTVAPKADDQSHSDHEDNGGGSHGNGGGHDAGHPDATSPATTNGDPPTTSSGGDGPSASPGPSSDESPRSASAPPPTTDSSPSGSGSGD